MNAGRWLGCGLISVAMILGCEKTAQIHYSPDFQRALYRDAGDTPRAYLVRADGTVEKDLGPSRGGYAWSDDSQTAYVAVRKTDKPTPYETTWAGEGALPPAPDDTPGTTILQVTDDDAKPLIHIAGEVLYLRHAPGGDWLAMQVKRDGGEDDTFTLHALNLDSGTLYLVRNKTGFGMGFTGPDTLVCSVPNGDGASGELIELTLRDSPQPPTSDRLLHVQWKQTLWISGDFSNLLFTTQPASYPATSEPDYGTLYHLTRKNAGLVALAERIGPLFSPSPDGSRILFEQAGDTRTLAVMNANGSGVRVLGKLPDDDPLMYPAWSGNDRITWHDEHNDVVEYQLTDTGELRPLRVLSKSWDPSMKPGAGRTR